MYGSLAAHANGTCHWAQQDQENTKKRGQNDGFLAGKCEIEAYVKEYGKDDFEKSRGQQLASKRDTSVYL